eukprot:CAMPEP_0174349494 /NCGR_PEP_ID=MMETSP0811_2-20130205/6239_1 /TAXON_ID=73025 ORGANISM="Eutreptiella gymnastica-like, Strain CCMP1594" /NCGR_SAMPLE_ID=MMETSP0811_2 /ASSEMBLY_ACC=CAM_ASM_000667 /LENGTH=53 /DNA_ID=CAMNT_0015476919 /DNA_START=581 /DNA_END=739 /DNA_ORIENTATION=+
MDQRHPDRAACSAPAHSHFRQVQDPTTGTAGHRHGVVRSHFAELACIAHRYQP